jgi:hypothetical protein
MNGQKAGMKTAVLTGGAFAGLLSGIPWTGCLCCLWILGGAMLAVYLYARTQSGPTTPGDGALIGAFSGLVASVVYMIGNVAFRSVNIEIVRRIFGRLSQLMEDFPAEMQDLINREAGPISAPQFVLSLAFSAVVFAGLGAVGGVLGSALFGKKPAASPPAGPPPPPPPAPRAS